MPNIKFEYPITMNAHPQAKLLGWELMTHVFNNNLSEKEIKMLKNGVDVTGTEHFALLNTLSEKKRLLICALLSKAPPKSVRNLYVHAKQDNLLPNKHLAETFLLSDDIDVITACFSTLSKAESKGVLYENAQYYLKDLASRGGVEVFKFYLNHPISEQRCIRNMLTTKDFTSLMGSAVENGHLSIIEYIESIDGFDINKIDDASMHQAYGSACKNGHLTIIEHIEALDGFDKKAAAKANDHQCYKGACENGHLNVIRHLEAIEGFDKKAAIEANDSEAYRGACLNGHLDVIQHFETIDTFDKKAAAEADDYFAYEAACENGDFNFIDYLESIEGFDKKAAAEAGDYNAYASACQYGHLSVIRHLESIDGFDKKAAAKANNYRTYGVACEKGHLGVIEHLESIEDFDKIAAAEQRQYQSYRAACVNGHLNVIQHLVGIDGFDEKAAAEVYGYQAYVTAYDNGHLPVVEHLLNIPSCLSYVECHDHEYGKTVTYSFVSEKLTQLMQEKTTFESAHPNGVFNLNRGDAELYFVVLRNLIRRSAPLNDRGEPREQEALLDEMRFLLSIPALRNLCHQAIRIETDTDNLGEENELLKLALRTNNADAAELLLGLPNVARLAMQNDYYQTERQGQLNLRRLAQDRESSMVALREGELRTVCKVKHHYQASIDEKGGNNVVFDEFIALLKLNYAQEPATISILNTENEEEVIDLPIEWDELDVLQTALTTEQYQAALQEYYKHDVHTTLRYLSKPNKWMHPEAQYVNRLYDSQGNRTSESYSTFEDYKALISLFYFASHDELAPGIDGYSIENRKAHFIEELALIGRAHNWDKSRPVVGENGAHQVKNGKVVTEEYDDLESDKPSCYSGVNRRLFQSVLGHGLFKTVTPPIIKQAINEQLIHYFKDVITPDNASSLKEAYEGLIEMEGDSEVHLQTLRLVNIPKDKKAMIINEVSTQLSKAYKENFDENIDSFKTIMKTYLDSSSAYQPDIMAFNESLSLDTLIEERVTMAAEKNKRHSTYSSFFAPSNTAPETPNRDNCSPNTKPGKRLLNK